MSSTLLRFPDIEDLNRDGQVSLGERASATFTLCAGVWLFLQVLYIGGCLLFGVDLAPGWLFWRRVWLGLTLLLVGIGGVVLFVWRLLEYEKRERQANEDRDHRRERQQFELDQLRGVTSRETDTRYTQADIDAAARIIMTRYYNGETWTRDACVSIGLKKELWDRANALLKKRRIRIGNRKRLEPGDFAEAWGIYVEKAMENSQHTRHYDGLLDLS